MEFTDRAYAAKLDVSTAERERILRCLENFPLECRSRGMFFEGVLDAVGRARGGGAKHDVLRDAGIAYRLTSFGLFPHRDFYRVFYKAARLIHPTMPIGEGMKRIALEFYPAMFAESLAGKTMALLLGNDPAHVLGRFVDAYRIAVPWNEHSCTQVDGSLRWTCKVEPCPHYASTIEGIATGMVRTVTGATPMFRLVSHDSSVDAQRFVFDVTFR